jgi:dihydroxyacetone kinase-like predicted kinase
MAKYSLEFILNVRDASPEMIKNSVAEFAEGVELVRLEEGILGRGKDFCVKMQTDEPTIIFDTCAQFGRIKSMKVEEK